MQKIDHLSMQRNEICKPLLPITHTFLTSFKAALSDHLCDKYTKSFLSSFCVSYYGQNYEFLLITNLLCNCIGYYMFLNCIYCRATEYLCKSITYEFNTGEKRAEGTIFEQHILEMHL